MAKKILQVVESAYRATIEEQDDTVVWLSNMMKGAGMNLDLLLVGGAVNYVIKNQDPSGLAIGDWKQAHPPELAQDLEKLIGKGSTVYLVEDDATVRGLERNDFIAGIKAIPRAGMAKLFDAYDQVWHW